MRTASEQRRHAVLTLFSCRAQAVCNGEEVGERAAAELLLAFGEPDCGKVESDVERRVYRLFTEPLALKMRNLFSRRDKLALLPVDAD